MPDVVVDASAAVRAVLATQPGHDDARSAAEAANAAGRRLVAPDMYFYEVGNAIARTEGSTAKKARALLAAYELVEAAQPKLASFGRALEVAAPGKLSFYDAAYLALAEERDGLLWTEDRELLKRFPGRTASTAELLRRLR